MSSPYRFPAADSQPSATMADFRDQSTGFTTHPIVLWFVLGLALACFAHAEEGGVYNGSFEKIVAGARAPDGWQAAGDKAVVQELAVDEDAKRGRVARLRCTQFMPGKASSHAMIAQMRHVGVRSGRWYRLSLWARASDLEAGVVQLNLVNSRAWAPAGLSGSFVPGDDWQRHEFVFRAERDLKPADSRLAFYFLSTGTLWLDDVAIEETTQPKRQWLPAVTIEGAANALANSSFEAGQGWGCSAGRYYDWTANIFRRVGQWDESQSFHGKRSWKVTLSAGKPLMLYGGYTRLAAEVRNLELAHAGWVRTQPGQPCVFSVYVRADRPGEPVRISLKEPEDWRRGNHRSASVGREWQRIEVSHAPQGEFVRGCLGFDLPEGDSGERTLWIDAAQLERGTAASAYHPRAELEAGIATDMAGNIFTDPGKGVCFRLRAFNNSRQPKAVQGQLRATDFWDRTVWNERPNLEVGAGQAAERPYAVLAGRQGFFRIHWEPEDGLAQTLRCAVIEPRDEEDAIFGFNHAFGQDFLFPLAHHAGLRWWRDWSTQWDTVQPKQDAPLDFSTPDLHVNRVLRQNGRMLVLLPFPSAGWAAAVPPQVARSLDERRAKGLLRDSSAGRAIAACKPQRLEDFAEYVRATVKHCQGRVTHYEILNEPLYTHYALPSASGYKMSDYLDMLRTAYEAAKAADPKCTIIGGIACWPGKDWLDQFIEQGGLRWCDISNYHMYPTRQRAETLEIAFRMRWEQMRQRGEAKPIWVTEFGLYAEDEPATIPSRAGDSTMNDAMRPDERTASVDLVQLAAVMFAHGVRKVFYHAGVCQGYHDSSTGNMFFEYGGAPRKMYPAVAAMARLLAPDFQFVRKWDQPEWLRAYEFRSRGRTVVVLWTRKPKAPPLDVPAGFQVLDLMGNPVEGREVVPGESPLYLVGR